MPKFRASKIEKLIKQQIMKPTRRDEQITIGPSGIGGCYYCIAETMSQHLPEPPPMRKGGFSLSAWQGTGLHYYVEHSFDIPNTEHERRVEIFDVSDYGKITGTIDLWLKDFNATLDWKRQNKWSYTEAVTDGPSAKHIVQQMCYGAGLIAEGHTIEKVGICAIPGFSNNIDDIRFYWLDYDPEVVENAHHNLSVIWEYVKEDKWKDLPSDEDCYTCLKLGR